MTSFLRFLESIKIFLFLFGICAFDISTKSGTKIETRPIHTALIVVAIVGYIFGLVTIGVDKLADYRLFYSGLSGAVLLSVSLTMASSFVLLLLFALVNRNSQIQLLRKIDVFDRQMHENVKFHIDSRKYRANLIAHMIVFVLYEMLLFVTQVMFKYNDDSHLMLFFTLYAVSDVTLTAHTAYVILFGKFLMNRYTTLNQQLKIILNPKCQSKRKKFRMLMSLYEKLFRLQMNVMDCFGSMLLFSIMFHMVAITVSVYVLINDISAEFHRLSYYVVTFISWTLPYFVRISHISSTFAKVQSQVCSRYYQCLSYFLVIVHSSLRCGWCPVDVERTKHSIARICSRKLPQLWSRSSAPVRNSIYQSTHCN